MDSINIFSMIKPGFIGLSVVLLILGVWLKAVKKIPNCLIPFILTAFGVMVAMAVSLANCQPGNYGEIINALYDGLLQGFFAAAGAVMTNQMGKQAKKED